jgi:hypothetical protein
VWNGFEVKSKTGKMHLYRSLKLTSVFAAGKERVFLPLCIIAGGISRMWW